MGKNVKPDSLWCIVWNVYDKFLHLISPRNLYKLAYIRQEIMKKIFWNSTKGEKQYICSKLRRLLYFQNLCS